MAKSKTKPTTKKVLDDEDEPQIAEDDVDADVDVEADEVEVEVEADEEPADDDDDGDLDTETETEPSTPLPPPKSRMTKTTKSLIFLNWMVALAFIVFAFLVTTTRARYSYWATLNHIHAWGLPLAEEKGDTHISIETRPVLRLNHDQLIKIYKRRPGTKQYPIDKEKDKFVAVEEPVPLRLNAGDVDERVMKDIFQSLTDHVPTLDAEIERLKDQLPIVIEQAATDVLKKTKDTDDAKREVIHKALLPITRNIYQIRDLDKVVSRAKAKDLDDLVIESVQRRIYYDILAPINVYRPGDLNVSAAGKHPVDRIAEVDKSNLVMKLDEIKAMLTKRLDSAIAANYDLDLNLGEVYEKEKSGPDAMKRHGVEKRQIIAFILFTVGHVQVPITNERLIAKGIERAQVISGIYENTNASIRFVESLRTMQDRVEEAVVADRQGYVINNAGKLTRTDGFIDEYEDWIDRLVKIVENIDTAKKRLDDVKTQRDHLQNVHAHRTKQLQETLDKLLTARKNTERYAKDLRELQEQLHAALVELSDAADRNFRLHDLIQEIELGLRVQSKKKGGAKLP